MAGREKLEGNIFGDFTAVSYIGGKKYKIVCNCCGEEKEIYGANLKKCVGVICSKKKEPVVDLTGQYIGEWYVDEYVGNKKNRCICSCGTLKDVLKVNLINGSSKSCGHAHNDYGDISKQTFGEWTVLKKHGYKWECQCSCGKIGYHSSADLVLGRTKSCGHSYFIDNNDIVGKEFGRWKLLEYIGSNTYLCQCSCNKKTQRKIKRYDLLYGKTKSCGCIKSDMIKETLFNRYGETAPNKALNPRSIEQINAVSSRENLKKFIDTFEYKPYSLELANELGIGLSRLLVLVHKYKLEDDIIIDSKVSYNEQRLIQYIKSIYNGSIETNNRTVLSGKELDIYIPEKKLAIEFNGSYWHSSVFKDKHYHQQKTIECAKQGIRLVHIFEHEWNNYENLIKSFLKNIIYDNKNTYYARDVFVKEVESDIAKDFCEKYHLQGWSSSKISVGCYNNNELLSLMTFSKPRFNDNYEYEIVRYCVKDGVSIVGGAQKLFKYFLNTYNPSSIITYSDLSKFTGNIYLKLGFKVLDITSPNYIWISSDMKNILSRYQTQKHKLLEKGLGTEEQTEDDIMYNLNYFKVYDSGNIKLEWKKQEI